MPISEEEVLFNLLDKEDFSRKVIPYIRPEYFSDDARPIFSAIKGHFHDYNALPSRRVIELSIQEDTSLNETRFSNVIDKLYGLNSADYEIPWLIDKTEVFCQEAAIYNALTESISIADGKTKTPKSNIPLILSEALAVSFDTRIGHDYFDDFEERYTYYHNEMARISTDIDTINLITKGGFPRKTLSVLAASTGVGKSLMLCHFAKVFAQCGYNVIYITLELSEHMIGERIDANMIDVALDDLRKLSKTTFESKLNFVKQRRPGKLIIKEFPTGGANVEHFRSLLRELKIKKNFHPDIIVIDYLTICSSVRYAKTDTGSYFIGKSIAEEVRGLMVEYDAAGLSAVQFNRGGQNNSDSDLSNIAESAAIAMTADIVLGLISTDELRKLNQVMARQLKNRFGDLNYYNKFILGVDYPKMRVFDLNPIDPILIKDKTRLVLKEADDEGEALYRSFKEEEAKAKKALGNPDRKDKFKDFT